MRKALWRRTGRRGLFLLFLAGIDTAIGYFTLYSPPGERPQLYPILPHEAWGIIWLTGAAICLAGVTASRDRIPYALAVALKTGWGLRYAYQWYLGVQYAWVTMAIWLGFALITVVVASWPEAPPPLTPEQIAAAMLGRDDL